MFLIKIVVESVAFCYNLFEATPLVAFIKISIPNTPFERFTLHPISKVGMHKKDPKGSFLYLCINCYFKLFSFVSNTLFFMVELYWIKFVSIGGLKVGNKVAVIFTGGTISMKVDPRLNAAIPGLTSEEIMGMVTNIEKFTEIERINFGEYPGPHIDPEMMMELSKLVKNTISRDDITGVVVTHGTDTLEETAYLLDLTIKPKKPIVIVGAMRNSSELGYDGPSNLSAAICTAISKEAVNKGVLVVMNNEVNAASEVTKTNTLSLDTFKSPEFGPLGIVDNDEVIFYRDIINHDHIETENIESKVALLKSVAGMDSDLIDYCIGAGYKGIVVEAMGRGNVPIEMYKGIKRSIEKNIPVVIVSRCPTGRVLDTYGYPGGGKNLRNIGAIFGNNLPGQKARIKLMLLLSIYNDIQTIKDIFEKDIYTK